MNCGLAPNDSRSSQLQLVPRARVSLPAPSLPANDTRFNSIKIIFYNVMGQTKYWLAEAVCEKQGVR